MHVDSGDYTVGHPDATLDDHIWSLIHDSGVLIRSENPDMTGLQALKYLGKEYDYATALLMALWRALAPDDVGGMPYWGVEDNGMVMRARRMHAARAEAGELLGALTTDDDDIADGYLLGEYDEYECGYCGGKGHWIEAENRRAWDHAPDCPVLRARAWLAKQKGEGE